MADPRLPTFPAKWTLVRHAGFGHAPGFGAAVEEAMLTRRRDVDKVQQAGGLVFETYVEASHAAIMENYPPEVTGIHPCVRGTFASIKISGRPLYLPRTE